MDLSVSPPLLSPVRTLVTGFRATLIQSDLILTLTLINLQRPFFQIRSHSEVPGRHVFGRWGEHWSTNYTFICRFVVHKMLALASNPARWALVLFETDNCKTTELRELPWGSQLAGGVGVGFLPQD